MVNGKCRRPTNIASLPLKWAQLMFLFVFFFMRSAAYPLRLVALIHDSVGESPAVWQVSVLR